MLLWFFFLMIENSNRYTFYMEMRNDRRSALLITFQMLESGYYDNNIGRYLYKWKKMLFSEGRL